MKISVFILGEPYCQNKTRGNIHAREVWSQAIIEATQNLPRITSECKAEIGERSLSKEAREEINEHSRQGFNTIRKVTDMGAFIISPEALSILQDYWKEGENKPDPQNWYAIFDYNYEKASSTVDKLTAFARKDLRV